MAAVTVRSRSIWRVKRSLCRFRKLTVKNQVPPGILLTLMGVSYFWQLVIKGAVIIIAVLIDKYRTRHHQSA